MSTTRDPLVDPQPGDKIQRVSDSGLVRTREVINRVDNDIFYRDQAGREKKCWIATWMEWGRIADVVTTAK